MLSWTVKHNLVVFKVFCGESHEPLKSGGIKATNVFITRLLEQAQETEISVNVLSRVLVHK